MPWYKHGSNEISSLAEYYKLEPTIVLTEWKEFSTTLSQFSNAQDALISLIKHQEVFPNLTHIVLLGCDTSTFSWLWTWV